MPAITLTTKEEKFLRSNQPTESLNLFVEVTPEWIVSCNSHAILMLPNTANNPSGLYDSELNPCHPSIRSMSWKRVIDLNPEAFYTEQRFTYDVKSFKITKRKGTAIHSFNSDHNGTFIFNTIELYRILKHFNPEKIVWKDGYYSDIPHWFIDITTGWKALISGCVPLIDPVTFPKDLRWLIDIDGKLSQTHYQRWSMYDFSFEPTDKLTKSAEVERLYRNNHQALTLTLRSTDYSGQIVETVVTVSPDTHKFEPLELVNGRGFLRIKALYADFDVTVYCDPDEYNALIDALYTALTDQK